ncbi:MAG: histidine kinase [Ignavibacteriaceae bacterium]|nr:histidine kinase [Ignavibacteriaceae bacterium]
MDGLVYNYLLFGMGLGFWYPARFISIEDNSITKIVISHLLGAVLATGFWILIGHATLNFLLDYYNLNSFETNNMLAWRSLIGAMFYFLIVSFYYMTIYYVGYREREIEETVLKNLITQAELKSLKFQINPHFIFNSLNSMSALTSIDPERARSMILKLADFLRYTLANSDKQKNKLREELANIKLYLDIEKIRFEDKFEFKEELDDVCLDHPVPNMILQPLFENAIKHAVYEAIEPVTLTLKCAPVDEFLKITLENNFEETGLKKKGAGIGLKNISDRLALIYGTSNLMKIETTDNIFRIVLFIPR